VPDLNRSGVLVAWRLRELKWAAWSPVPSHQPITPSALATESTHIPRHYPMTGLALQLEWRGAYGHLGPAAIKPLGGEEHG